MAAVEEALNTLLGPASWASVELQTAEEASFVVVLRAEAANGHT
jgi:hypothetical protein